MLDRNRLDWTCWDDKVPCLVKLDGRKWVESCGQETEGSGRKQDGSEMIQNGVRKCRKVIVGDITQYQNKVARYKLLDYLY